MTKARLLAIVALGFIAFDVLVNFSIAMMNTAMDITTFVIVGLLILTIRFENKDS